MFRRASAVLPSLSRFGVGRAMYSSAYGDLPALARDEERAFWATPRHARSVRDEFSQIRTTMTEAQALTTLGDRPLVVLTAEKDAQGGWIGRAGRARRAVDQQRSSHAGERRPRHAHKHYYALHGQRDLRAKPPYQRPHPGALIWHNEHRFRG